MHSCRTLACLLYGCLYIATARAGDAIDAATRAAVVNGAVANLNESYVFPEKAKEMEKLVRANLHRGRYDSVTDGAAFAGALTEDLRSVSHDKHLRVYFNPKPSPADSSVPATTNDFRAELFEMNCGFNKLELLPQNVGYVKLDMFADPDVCGETAVAAMNFLAHAGGLIFDLRENGGGEPRMIALISTYLFADPTHLNDLWTRKTDSTQQFWTLPFVPGQRMPSVPVYVLTSAYTFSGAEEFAHNLKVLKRATIIGEVTGGGAHPVDSHRIDDHFSIGVPFARAVNPVTKTNWEGRGVEPDVKVPASEALDKALSMAQAEIGAMHSLPVPSN